VPPLEVYGNAAAKFFDGTTNGLGQMETNVNRKIYRSMMASLFSVSFATASIMGLADDGLAQSVKKITPDPYYSTLRQTPDSTAIAPDQTPSAEAGSFYQSTWNPPNTALSSTPARQSKIKKAKEAAEVWSSVARKTTKPVTRIDFSRLNINPPKKAEVALPAMKLQPLKPVVGAAASNAVAKTATALKSQALTPIKAVNDTVGEIAASTTQPLKDAREAIRSALAKSRSIIRQKDADANSSPALPPVTTPVANSSPPEKARALKPWKDPAEFNLPKIGSKLPAALSAVSQASATDQREDSSVNVASKIAAAGDNSFVQQAAYQPQLGQRLKKMVEGRPANTAKSAPTPVAAGSGPRVADASNNYYDSDAIYTPQGEIYSQPATVSDSVSQDQYHQEGTLSQETYQETYEAPYYQGESFENSRVLALVGGHPVFVGDMMFEVNQIFEKHMKGAPQAAKDAQKGKLMARLLPKYVDQKILYVSTLDQLPEEAKIDEILKQAEVTFNEKALPEMMKNSGVESVAKFDGILRSQGTSVRQMRRSWAKDQISKFFLQEKVQYNRQVTHLEMLDEYRSNYDEYAIKGKVRFEQIEIQPAKAGGRFAAKDKIEDIYDRLVHGGNFEAIAKKESHGFRAFKGGQYDWTSKGSLVNKEIDKSIFTLPQGKLSGVIETKSGFHIIRVIERVEDHHTPFTEAQVEIKKQLLGARRDEAFRSYIDGLKDKINVEYVNE
jgi:parvulin-like peptidyl-prolyl isomerase